MNVILRVAQDWPHAGAPEDMREGWRTANELASPQRSKSSLGQF